MVGQGHTDDIAITKAKEILRKKHPQGVRNIEVARYVGCSQSRAARILDHLSGDCGNNENTVTDFLIYTDDEYYPTRYGIFKDIETGISL